MIGNQIFPLKCGFGIGYGIGRNYQPIWVSVSVSDRNQNSGFGRTLDFYIPVILPPTIANAIVIPNAINWTMAWLKGVYSDPGSSDMCGKYMLMLKK